MQKRLLSTGQNWTNSEREREKTPLGKYLNSLRQRCIQFKIIAAGKHPFFITLNLATSVRNTNQGKSTFLEVCQVQASVKWDWKTSIARIFRNKGFQEKSV
uniref:Uncharacterized protein n=1 Tax=Micrurus lemniscatus lemniscatus TaxID=129467 RepID=A0A2D4HQH6_MICLE